MLIGKRKYIKTTYRELKEGDRFFFPDNPDKLYVAGQDLSIVSECCDKPVNKIVK